MNIGDTPASESVAAPKRRSSGSHHKFKLLTRAELDGRTTAAKQFDAIAAGIAVDLGGEAELSTVQKHLVEAFAGVALHVGDCNARLLQGETVDIFEHMQAISALVRVASRLGLQRRSKPVMTLDQYIAEARKREGVAQE